MKVKTFSGSSLPEAITKAKQEFGENIILLESKEISAGRTKSGRKLVQVTISADEQPRKTVKAWTPPNISEVYGQPKKETPKPKTEQAPKTDHFNRMIQDILAKKPKELNQEKQILTELAELRDQISQLSERNVREPEDALPAFYNEVKEELTDKGVEEKLAIKVVKRAYQMSEEGPDAGKAEIVELVKNELRRSFQSYNFKKITARKKKRVVLLVGATGVGKTTSAMKLAAHQDIFGKREVLIVSTDLYGPSEALKAFTKMNGTTVLEKKRVDELKDVMETVSDEIVLVDTPGQSPFAPNYLSRLEEYMKAVKPNDVFLVLSMNSDLKDLYLSAALYMLLKPSAIVLTKFDETAQPGKVFSILNELNIPIAAFGDGKRIFIDTQLPQADYVLDKIFERKQA